MTEDLADCMVTYARMAAENTTDKPSTVYGSGHARPAYERRRKPGIHTD